MHYNNSNYEKLGGKNMSVNIYDDDSLNEAFPSGRKVRRAANTDGGEQDGRYMGFASKGDYLWDQIFR